ncbi:MAG: SET domain-containing protein-lysine N-methyltransferase [Polyangiaceae bacterium]|nr:SET domain-containing protein-lysine N-methyltransferase [Polyangiaceae bacterium]
MADDPIARMLAWLTAGGVRCDAFELRAVPGDERGAFAARPLAEGERVLELPSRFMITEETARASAIGERIAAGTGGRANAHSYLAAQLLEERRSPASFFRPFIDALPASYRHMPMFYHDKELFFLNGSVAQKSVQDRWDSYMGDYHFLVAKVPGFDAFGVHDFVWARLTVCTRTFGVSAHGARVRSLVPLADMLNHHLPPEASWGYDERAAAFTLTAERDVAPGEPVRTTYGRRSNAHLLINYGFVIEGNEHDVAGLRLEIPPGDPLLDAKAAALGPGPASRLFEVPVGYQRAPVRKMFSFLRLALADGPDLARATGPGGPSVEEIPPLSARNEEAVLAAISAAAAVSLAGFDTSVAQDEAILRRLPLSPNQRRCMILRMGEKRVLGHYQRLAGAAAPLLGLTRLELERALALGEAGGPDLADYVKDALIPLAQAR